MNEFLEQFLIESRELVDLATGELLALEKAPADKERLDGAFRAMHTLKGGAGIVDFSAMSRAVHAAEDALSAVRSGTRDISANLIGDCLSCVDQVVQWLDTIEATGVLPVAADAAADRIVARFGYIVDPVRQDEAMRPAEESERGDVAVVSAVARRILNEQLLVIAEVAPAGREGRVASAARVAANVSRRTLGEVAAASIEKAASVALDRGQQRLLADAIAKLLEPPSAAGHDDTSETARRDSAARTLRVDAERVDALVNLTGELIVAKNGIAHIAKLADESGNALATSLHAEQARLERLIESLQYTVLSLRVLPLRTVFQRFSRVIREMSVNLEKPAALVVEGEDTEADKAVVEMLFEPLLHVVRNAMDHGIETAAERAAAGKPSVATITLRARRPSEHVVVEVIDDGRGIDIERVRKVAATRGVATEDILSAMNDQEITQLVFAPGFSTATEVTDLSGRGVGMDAVRTAVERMGGRVSVESEQGRGTAVRLVLPYSVMMTRVMTVESVGQTFGIPLDAVVETVRIPRDHIQPIGEAGAFVIRNRTVPLIDLAATLGSESPPRYQAEVTAVITSVSGQLAALAVDRVGQRMDVMLKPIEGLLAGTPGIAGTTLLGDGRVLLVLDLQELLA